MKEGWGFYRPHKVRQIGFLLEEVFKESEDLEKEVEVTFYSGHYYGSDFHYTYTWYVDYVDGVRPKGNLNLKNLKLKPDMIDIIFGYSQRNF